MSTPSSRRTARSGRGSVASTPSRAARTTPQPSRQPPSDNIAASSSPLFYRSSPATATPRRSQPANGDFIISSPPKQPSVAGDREATPKATRAQNVAGRCFHCKINHAGADQTQIPLLYDTIPAQALPDLGRNETMRLPAVVDCFCGLRERGYRRDEETYTQTTLQGQLPTDEEYSSEKTACQSEMPSRPRKPPSQTQTRTHQTRICWEEAQHE